MKTRFLALCLGAALVTGACGAEDDSTLDTMDDRTPMTEPATPPAGSAMNQADEMVSGTIVKVDADARTFTLNADNREQTFRYNDSTNVTGASGIQGLAGREGSRVTVHYRDEAGSMMASRIIIEGGAAQPAGSPSSSQPSAQQPSGSSQPRR